MQHQGFSSTGIIEADSKMKERNPYTTGLIVIDHNWKSSICSVAVLLKRISVYITTSDSVMMISWTEASQF